VAVVVDVTVLVVTVKVAVVLPAGTATLAGTVADELVLERVTVMPPVGAAAFKVTVPVDELPPATEAGFSETEDSAGAGAMVSTAV
jgi:hypothetical protein